MTMAAGDGQTGEREGPVNWYASMPSFLEFKDLTKDMNYRTPPEDWYVVITDVKGSTKAIEEGRYKDVNIIGAASISTVTNMLGHEDFPCVFGGDGATLMVAPKDIDRVMESLLKLQRLSEQNFRLSLRVGRITVREVHETRRSSIQVAKHQLPSGKSVGIFRGGGLAIAEARIKGEEDKYCLTYQGKEDDNPLFELGRLNCRFNPIPNKRGMIMSLLVGAREDKSPGCGRENAIYNQLLAELDKIYDGDLDEANPVHPELLTFKSTLENIRDERRLFLENVVTRPAGFMRRISDILSSASVFRGQADNLPPWASQFQLAMRSHSDHRKFDEMLRMIIDCSKEQAAQVEALLEGLRVEGKVHYGIFKSETALMTCFVEDVTDGHHIHFIDGGDGGYAMAAKQLKAQLKEEKEE